MATTKMWSVGYDVAHVAEYIRNPVKTIYDELIMPRTDVPVADEQVDLGDKTPKRLICGIHCEPESAVEEFFDVKIKFNKNTGVLAYHGYISFPNIDGLDPVDVLSISREIANEMWGDRFQVLLAVHSNTETLHCHFLVNSVSYVDGKKAVDNEKNYYRLKGIADNTCKKYGLTVPKRGRRKKIDFPALETQLVNIRMESPNTKSLIENLDKAGIKYCGHNYIRIKDGRFVKLSTMGRAVENLFKYVPPTEPYDENTILREEARLLVAQSRKRKKKKEVPVDIESELDMKDAVSRRN